MEDYFAYIFQSGSDYRLAVSVPDGTTLQAEDLVSFRAYSTAVVLTTEAERVEVSSVTTSDEFLTGGTVAYLVLTQEQYDELDTIDVDTIDNAKFFFKSQFEFYNRFAFPRESILIFNAYFDTTNNFTFSLPSNHGLSDNDLVSFRFVLDTNVFQDYEELPITLIDPNTLTFDAYESEGTVGLVTIPDVDINDLQAITYYDPATDRFYIDEEDAQLYPLSHIPTNTVTLAEVPDGIAVGDELYFFRNTGTLEAPEFPNQPLFAGIVEDTSRGMHIEYSTELLSSVASTGDFFLLSKSAEGEASGVLGVFGVVTFTNDDDAMAELFAINTEVHQSSR